MLRASLVFKGLVIVVFVAALGANVACAQTSQPDEPAYGRQLRGDDQGATSQNSDDSREDNPSARDSDNPGAQPDQGDSAGSTDSDQNNDGNDSGSSEQENR